MTTKYAEKTEVKEVVRFEEIGTFCDWCKEEIQNQKECDENYPQMDTDIRVLAITNCYGDYHTAKGWKIDDLCKDCSDKLRVALEKMGIIVSEAWD